MRIIAVNGEGESVPGGIATFETVPEVPAAPQGLMVVTKGNTSVKLRWRAPEAKGGAPLTGYR